MPYNGSGVFVPLVTFVDNTTATAEDQNSQDQDIANGLTDCMTRDGLAAATANMKMGGFRITGLASGSAATDAASVSQVQIWGGTSAGTSNAQTVTIPAFNSTDGQKVSFVAGATNSGAMTLNGIPVQKDTLSGPAALTGNEVISGNVIQLTYSTASSSFQLANYLANPTTYPLTSLASATTTNLGSIASQNVLITGTTTITSFGSSASTNYPLYFVKFAGILTLTYDATALIIPGSASITTAANDAAYVLYLGSGHWQIVSYEKADGTALVVNSQLPSQSTHASALLMTDGANASWSRNSTVVARATGTALTTSPVLESGSVNVASVSITSTGIVRFTFSVALASTNYQAFCEILDPAVGTYFRVLGTRNTAYVEFAVKNSGAALNTPPAMTMVIYGGF